MLRWEEPSVIVLSLFSGIMCQPWWSYPCDIRASGKPAALAAIWNLSLFVWGRTEPEYLEIMFCTWYLSRVSFTALEMKEMEVREERL